VGIDVRPLRRLLIVPLAVVATATACGGGSTADNVSGTSGGTPSPAVSGSEISVKETEYTLSPTALNLKAGSYTITVTNVGQFPHDLHVAAASDGTEVGGSTVVMAGQSASFKVTLQPGQYTMWCAVDAHKSLGMQGTLTVQ
jgi:plastocyanin